MLADQHMDRNSGKRRMPLRSRPPPRPAIAAQSSTRHPREVRLAWGPGAGAYAASQETRPDMQPFCPVPRVYTCSHRRASVRCLTHRAPPKRCYGALASDRTSVAVQLERSAPRADRDSHMSTRDSRGRRRQCDLAIEAGAGDRQTRLTILSLLDRLLTEHVASRGGGSRRQWSKTVA
jgi:hypothetical protein